MERQRLIAQTHRVICFCGQVLERDRPKLLEHGVLICSICQAQYDLYHESVVVKAPPPTLAAYQSVGSTPQAKLARDRSYEPIGYVSG